jgi:putative transcriptional regulator
MALNDYNSGNRINSLKGKLLISEPFLHDPYFQRSVVLMTEYDPLLGATGLILNKPIDLSLNDGLTDFPPYDGQVYLGGPVHKDNLFFIHTLGDKIEDSIEIMPGLFWGGNFETIKQLISSYQIDHNEIRFFAGFSGWETTQLEKEIEEQAWIVTDASPNLIMNTNDDKMWSEVLKRMGAEYAILANFPLDPSLN